MKRPAFELDEPDDGATVNDVSQPLASSSSSMKDPDDDAVVDGLQPCSKDDAAVAASSSTPSARSFDCEMLERASDIVTVDMSWQGLNVRPEYCESLLDRTKDIEVRKYALGTHGTSNIMYLIKTKGNQKAATPSIVGIVEFASGHRQYTSADEFEADRHRHLIPARSEFDIRPDSPTRLYAWWVRSVIRFHQPISLAGLPARSMIGWSKPVRVQAQVSRLDSMRIHDLKTHGHSY